MKSKTNIFTMVALFQSYMTKRMNVVRWVAMAVAVVLVMFLAFYNLTDYPLTWFDEGSHLHVPKTLVRFGVYADYSSEGFRYYGPTIGVGPTVMLPIAAMFGLFGIGLLQARMVIVIYLLGTLYAFYRLARMLGGQRLAWVATILLVTCRGVAMLMWGRQVLGEVPGLFFVVLGLALWFAEWERSSWWRLIVVGVCFGLAAITKYQYLLFLAPTLILAWLTNLMYYRTAPQRTFILPGLATGVCFALWQVYMIFNLGPATAVENFNILREQSAGAAFTFSLRQMEASLDVLVSLSVYLGGLLPVMLYGFFLAFPRRREAQQWGIILILIATNLGWYVVASIGWWRYAFLGLAMAALFVARFFHDQTDGFRFGGTKLWEGLRKGELDLPAYTFRWAMLIWLAAIIVVPLGQYIPEIALPTDNAPRAMAIYLDENVPQDALIETWEPEMGFLTDHLYHFPPAYLLTVAVNQVNFGGTPVRDMYHFVETERPDYVLVGAFASSVQMYSPEHLAAQYELETSIGTYDLYVLKR